jgi:thioredoxin reductase
MRLPSFDSQEVSSKRREEGLICDRIPYIVELENGARIPARSIVIATGARYRKLALENLSRFEGAGVYQVLRLLRHNYVEAKKSLSSVAETLQVKPPRFWPRVRSM